MSCWTRFRDVLGYNRTTITLADIVVLMGDFNAKVGYCNSNWGTAWGMGKDGMGDINDNGELSTDLVVNYDLAIGGTLFSHQYIAISVNNASA